MVLIKFVIPFLIMFDFVTPSLDWSWDKINKKAKSNNIDYRNGEAPDGLCADDPLLLCPNGLRGRRRIARCLAVGARE